MPSTTSPRLTWDWGTAYDLFASLHVLHHPARFGLRGQWAAGVRSRLAASQRKTLEEAQELVSTPLSWIYSLPAPKDASVALWRLGQLPPAERLPALGLNLDMPEEMRSLLGEIHARGSWNESDQEQLRLAYQHKGWQLRPKTLTSLLDGWAHAAEFGEAYLAALQAYYNVFFAEEERRIRPVLQTALSAAQQMAAELDFLPLVEKLSQGLQIASLAGAQEVVLVPAYWTTPLVVYGRIAPRQYLMMFGGRPADVTLVPGEMVPDALLRALKALSDPTRLRMLRYLAGEPLTLAELSRRLRLRLPTMNHHLNALRLAGLVYVSLDPENEKRYTIRAQAVADTFQTLEKFLAAGAQAAQTKIEVG